MVFETAIAAPVFGLRREMNRLLDDVLTHGTPGSGANTWAPPVDVWEDQEEITIVMEIPGLSPDQVDVTTENGVLTVRGEKRTERKEGERRYHLVERSYGSFTRTFQLPKGVDESKIGAEFLHGVLTVHVPKAALPQPKKIAISVPAKDGTGD